jgi:ATP:ADP antiporter, AAA family
LVIASGATFAALLASYGTMRPVRDALALEGNPDQIPWLFLATFIAVSVVSPVWSALLGRRSRRTFVALAFHAFAACAIGFFVVVHSGIAPITVGRVFYIWSSVFNLFVVSVFWSLLADLLGPTVARRLYGPIAAGGTLGAMLGAYLTKQLVGTIGVAAMLIVAAALLELAVIGVGVVRRTAVALPSETGVADETPAAPVLGGALTGIAHVARSPYLAALAGYVLCTACAATFMYLAQARIVHAELAGKVARTEFFASIDLWTNVAALALQTVLAAPLIGWFGPGIVLAVLPLAQAIGISALTMAPSLTALALAQVVTRSATHGLTRPARELLFTVISRDEKYRAKHAIDTVAYRMGDVASSFLYKAVVALGVLIGATLALATMWLTFAVLLGAGFRRRRTKGPR